MMKNSIKIEKNNTKRRIINDKNYTEMRDARKRTEILSGVVKRKKIKIHRNKKK